MKNHVYLLNTQCLEKEEVFRDWYQKMLERRRRKIDAFRFGRDKRLSLGAGILLQHLLLQAGAGADSLSVAPGGKPFLAGRNDLHFNLSHAGSMVACAASDCPVGVDVEEEKHFEEELCRFVFHDREIEWIRKTMEDEDAGFTALWTIKESLLKYQGTGILVDPKRIFIHQSEPVRADCQDFACQKLMFTRYSLPGYQLTVCSEYGNFAEKPEWLFLA